MNWYQKLKISTAQTEWQQADSSAIDRYRYDSINRRFYVRFNNGRTYYYDDVPPSTYENFQDAPSKGRFFVENIQRRFEASRVS